MNKYNAIIDKILAENPPHNEMAKNPIWPVCSPVRDKLLTGKNQLNGVGQHEYPYRSAEPSTILFDEDGYAYKADEPLPRRYAVDWPAGVMKVSEVITNG